jgi:hypothetical protein
MADKPKITRLYATKEDVKNLNSIASMLYPGRTRMSWRVMSTMLRITRQAVEMAIASKHDLTDIRKAVFGGIGARELDEVKKGGGE